MGRKKRRVGSKLEETLAMQLRAHGIVGWEREYRFLKRRRYRYDFAWPKARLAVELQGGIWMRRGGHNTAAGITRDCQKMNYSTLAGWRVLLFVPDDLKDGVAISWIKAALDRIERGVLT